MVPDKKMRPYELVAANTRLNVWIGGHGPILLLLHAGYGDAEFSWQYVWNELAENFTVIAPDLPGFGKSELGPNVSAADLTRVFSNLVKQFEASTYPRARMTVHEATSQIAPVVVVGNSFGGMLAFRFAQDYPALTKKLILVNGLEMPEMPHWVRKFLKMPYVHELFTRLGENLYYSDRALKGAFSKLEALPRNFLTTLKRNSHRSSQISADLWLNSEPTHVRIEAPISLIWGEDDKMVPLELTQKIRREYPSATVRRIPKARHMPEIEQPVKFISELKEEALC